MPLTLHVFSFFFFYIIFQVVFNSDEASGSVKEVLFIPGNIFYFIATVLYDCDDFHFVWSCLSVLKVSLVEQIITRVK